jgi:hypothetical protein
MARISEVVSSTDDFRPFKCNSAVTDNDVNKPVKLSASDTVDLCADGDQIYGWINSVEVRTEDGKTVVGIQNKGRKWVTLSGASAVGTCVEAHTNTAAGTALATNWGLVSTHTLVAGTVKKWMIIFGSGLDTSDALVELQ